MKYLFSVIALLSLAACLHRNVPKPVPANSRKVAVKLMDSLGVLTMYIPERYDTGFAWLHGSDCRPCDKMKCRFQYSGNTIFKENGFFYVGDPEDSVDQQTIIYHPYYYFGRPINIKARLLSTDHLLERHKAWGYEILIDTCMTVYDRQIAVVGSRYYAEKANRTLYELTAESMIKGNQIMFEFEMIREKKDSLAGNFLQNALDVVKTLRFSLPG